MLSTKGEHVVADVADADGLQEVVLKNGHRALAAPRTQQTSAMAAVMLAHRQRELAAAFRADVTLGPPRLVLQLICNIRFFILILLLQSKPDKCTSIWHEKFVHLSDHDSIQMLYTGHGAPGLY